MGQGKFCAPSSKGKKGYEKGKGNGNGIRLEETPKG